MLHSSGYASIATQNMENNDSLFAIQPNEMRMEPE